MFGTVRKHQQWLWIIIIVPTILSFVYWMGDTRMGGSGWKRGAELGTVGGRQVTQDMLIRANREASVYAELYFRGPGSEEARQMGFNLEQERLRRLLLNEKCREMKIEVSDEAVAAWVRENLKSRESGKSMYDEVVKGLTDKGYSEGDLIEFIRHEVARIHLAEVVGVASELITPREAEADFRRENEAVLVEIAFFPTSNQLASVTVDPAALMQFYTNQAANYRIPERLQVSYVSFPVTNFAAEAEQILSTLPELTNHLEKEYLSRGADAFRDKEDKVMSKEAAIAQMRTEFRDTQAMQFAQRRAAEFANELYRIEPIKAENLDAFAAAKGVPVTVSEPFTEYSRPPGLEDVPTLGQETFKLNAEQPFTTPVAGRKAAYLFALKQRLASEVQPFEKVQVRVTEDYKRSKAAEALRIVGQAFHATATNELSAGKSFATIATENGATLLTPPPIALNATTLAGFNPALVDIGTLKNVAFSLKPGEVSFYTAARGGGMVVFLKEKQQVDDARVKAELTKHTEELRRQNRGTAFAEWFDAEFKRSGLAQLMSPKNPPQ
jgi:hypothetical protein